jgi:hypothetical protein
MGEPAFLSEEFSHRIDPDLEIVTTSGFSKNGAISVLQVKNKAVVTPYRNILTEFQRNFF